MTPAESIDLLVADGIVDALIQRVKTGKEAEVFIVRKGEEYLAAKVYKERTARNFKNNVTYKEGRQVRNTRDARAMAKGTKYGLELSEADWRHAEHDALLTVAAAGVRVPKPDLFYEGVLLMELVLGSDGQPAPRLIDVPLTRDEAVAHHRDILGQIVGMLTCDLIHGDLSPYNILMAWNGPTIIDLPQVIKAAHNSQSEGFLIRDVRNITEHFARYAPELKKCAHDGELIWRKYVRRELARDYLPDDAERTARAQRPEPPRQHTPHAAPPRRPEGAPAPADRQRPPHRPAQQGAPRPAQQPPAQRPAPQGAPRPIQPGAPRPSQHGAPRPPHQRTAPHHGQLARQGSPGQPPSHSGTAGAPPPQQRREPHHGHPRHTPGASPRPHRPAEPPGPIIQRVSRLAPSHAPSQPDSSPGSEGRPARFNMHHRNRQGQ
jgi:RIO kinase 1